MSCVFWLLDRRIEFRSTTELLDQLWGFLMSLCVGAAARQKHIKYLGHIVRHRAQGE